MELRWLYLLPIYLGLYAATYWVAFLLRYDFQISPDVWEAFVGSVLTALACKLTAGLATRQMHRRHRYTTTIDLAYVGAAAVGAAILLAICNPFLPEASKVARSVILIDCVLTVLAVTGLRGTIRIYAETLEPMVFGTGERTRERTRVLIYGADSAAISILRAVRGTAPEYRVTGFLSGSWMNSPSLIADIPVFSALHEFSTIAKQSKASMLLIPAATPGKEIRELVHRCHEAGIHAHVIPAVEEIVSGRYRLAIRDVTISDLLRREPNVLDLHGIRRYITGKRVLVTGAAGSIGSELCRQILALQPDKLVLLDQSESGMFFIEQEFAGTQHGPTELSYQIADIRDAKSLSEIMQWHQPQIIFHAAAYKHVPLMEANPQEAIRNNVFGSKTLVDLADEWGVDRFVFVSTDKAVRPTSVMGSTKLVAEKYMQSMAQRSKTNFVTVRFGNVLNSVGSVVPTFKRQIAEGGPITVTHPDMNRYFMTIPEAVQLVLQAGAVGTSGAVLILDMGTPVKIVDLAKDMICLSGLKYPDDIDIVFTGLRPGEKLYEELFYESEVNAEKVHEKIFKAQRPPIPLAMVESSLDLLEAASNESNREAAITLKQVVGRFVEYDEAFGRQVKRVA
jgi:FlaA1/EpsC-like NDP-sugar epimerase